MVQLLNTVERIDAEPVNAQERRSLYAPRVKIHPKRVTGTFRTLKWWIMAVTLTIYYVTPWLRWDRGAHAPDQAVLVDIANRRFYFFFIEIWPQEFYVVAALLVMAGIGLFLITSTIGRAWCGYACPQTVWVDLFLVVERWVEGDRNARVKLDTAPWSFDKLRKRITKHAIWIVIAVATGGAWIFYFADAPSLARDFATFQAPAIAYTTVAFLTATTYVLAGFMREQVCTYMCPWPRIQGAMLDEHSLVVTYNDWRGEPRASQKQRRQDHGASHGDCIDCNLCVAVCPMGIDIRHGQQLECITCALCIDACNGVMDKIGRPRDLISYATLSDYTASAAGDVRATTWRSFIRPRTFVYFAAWSLIGLGLVYALVTRDRLDISVLPDRNPLYVQLSDGAIRNGYTVNIRNMRTEPRSFRLALEGIPGAAMFLAGSHDEPARALTLDVPADQLRSFKVYVRVERRDIAASRSDVTFTVNDIAGDDSAAYRTIFEAPED